MNRILIAIIAIVVSFSLPAFAQNQKVTVPKRNTTTTSGNDNKDKDQQTTKPVKSPKQSQSSKPATNSGKPATKSGKICGTSKKQQTTPEKPRDKKKDAKLDDLYRQIKGGGSSADKKRDAAKDAKADALYRQIKKEEKEKQKAEAKRAKEEEKARQKAEAQKAKEEQARLKAEAKKAKEEEKARLKEEAKKAKEALENEVFTVVDEKAQFKGGDVALYKWLNSNMKYPEAAKANGVEGRVTVQFVVEKNGQISGVEIVNGVDESIDSEALRLVQKMPKWKPAKVKGKNVRSYSAVAIDFTLP